MDQISSPIDWPTPGSYPQGNWQSPGYRSATLRSRAAVVLVGLVTIGYVVQSIITLEGFGLIEAAVDGTLTDAQAAAYDARSVQVGMLTLIAYV